MQASVPTPAALPALPALPALHQAPAQPARAPTPPVNTPKSPPRHNPAHSLEVLTLVTMHGTCGRIPSNLPPCAITVPHAPSVSTQLLMDTFITMTQPRSTQLVYEQPKVCEGLWL